MIHHNKLCLTILTSTSSKSTALKISSIYLKISHPKPISLMIIIHNNSISHKHSSNHMKSIASLKPPNLLSSLNLKVSSETFTSIPNSIPKTNSIILTKTNPISILPLTVEKIHLIPQIQKIPLSIKTPLI